MRHHNMIEAVPRMPLHERTRLHVQIANWFVQRYRVQREALAQAINADESIIAGKQRVFDDHVQIKPYELLPPCRGYRGGNFHPEPKEAKLWRGETDDVTPQQGHATQTSVRR